MKFIIVFLFSVTFCFAQYNVEAVKKQQENLIAFYADTTMSPLKKVDYENFQGIHFFPINEKYVVTAKFKRTKNEKPFAMKTSGKKTPTYVKYGEISFVIDGKKLKLDVFQNLDLVKNNPKYKNHLFLPFTDLTSGVNSYGGGRYIDLEIPNKKKFTLDFNEAYNPYCAYTSGYNCPIPPKQNDLEVEILAGVSYIN